MATLVHAVDKPNLPPFSMPDRFRYEVYYFMTPSGLHGVPALPEGEYWVRLDDARRWLEEGVLHVVSPLDSENQAEIELTEEHESWLEWMIANQVERIRLA